jgi:uncharacterized protein
LYTQVKKIAPELGVSVIVNGANADDASDYRPGTQAADEHEIRSPLAECGFTKQELRDLAAHWELPVWDKPAMPCLSSRIAYGEQVTGERLEMINRAEQYLRDRGFLTVRVRYHQGEMARIEVPAAEIPRLCQEEFRDPFVAYLKELGFRFIALDLEGFRSGSLNSLVPVEVLERIQETA